MGTLKSQEFGVKIGFSADIIPWPTIICFSRLRPLPCCFELNWYFNQSASPDVYYFNSFYLSFTDVWVSYLLH